MDSPSMLACGHTETSRSTVCEATRHTQSGLALLCDVAVAVAVAVEEDDDDEEEDVGTGSKLRRAVMVVGCISHARASDSSAAAAASSARSDDEEEVGGDVDAEALLCGSATTARGPIASFHGNGWPCFGRRRAVAKGARSAHNARRFCSSLTAPKLWPPPPPPWKAGGFLGVDLHSMRRSKAVKMESALCCFCCKRSVAARLASRKGDAKVGSILPPFPVR